MLYRVLAASPGQIPASLVPQLPRCAPESQEALLDIPVLELISAAWSALTGSVLWDIIYCNGPKQLYQGLPFITQPVLCVRHPPKGSLSRPQCLFFCPLEMWPVPRGCPAASAPSSATLISLWQCSGSPWPSHPSCLTVLVPRPSLLTTSPQLVLQLKRFCRWMLSAPEGQYVHSTTLQDSGVAPRRVSTGMQGFSSSQRFTHKL